MDNTQILNLRHIKNEAAVEDTVRETLKSEDKDYLTFGPAVIAMKEAFNCIKER